MSLAAAPILTISDTQIAARLIRYTVRSKPGQFDLPAEGEEPTHLLRDDEWVTPGAGETATHVYREPDPRVLHASGIGCYPQTAERDFAALRRKHGKQAAMRRARPTYVEVQPLADGSPPEAATHLRRGNKWVRATGSQIPTHQFIEGDMVRENEAVHIISSFGLDAVNPDNTEEVQRAFDYTEKMIRETFPSTDGGCAVQAHLVGQADGKGGQFHVHCVINAVLAADIEVGGKTWRAGRKMSQDLTDIDQLRKRHDAFTAEHGAEFGFETVLPEVGSKQALAETRTTQDRRMAARGQMSNHDIIREAFDESMNDPRSLDLESFKAVMDDHGVTVTEPGWRRGKPPKIRKLSYQTEDMGTPVRAQTLGAHYMFEDTVIEDTGEVVSGVISQLDDNAAGRPRQQRPEIYHTGAPKPLPVPTDAELAQAETTIEALAQQEQQRRSDPSQQLSVRQQQRRDTAAQRTQPDTAVTEPQQPTAVREIPEDAFSGYDGKPEPVMLKQMHGWSTEEIQASIAAWEAEHQEQPEARPIPAAALGADGRPSKFELMADHGFSPEESDVSIAAWEAEQEAQQDTEAAAEHSAAPSQSKPDAASDQAEATEQHGDTVAAVQLPVEDDWQQKARQRHEQRQRRQEEIAEAEKEARENPDAELADRVVTFRSQDGYRTATPGAMRDSGMGEVEVAAAVQSWITLRLPETASERAAAQESAPPPQHRPEHSEPSADPVPVKEPQEPAELPVEPAEPQEPVEPVSAATDEVEQQPKTQREVRDEKIGRTQETEADKLRRDLERKLRREGLDGPGSGRDDRQLG